MSDAFVSDARVSQILFMTAQSQRHMVPRGFGGRRRVRRVYPDDQCSGLLRTYIVYTTTESSIYIHHTDRHTHTCIYI